MIPKIIFSLFYLFMTLVNVLFCSQLVFAEDGDSTSPMTSSAILPAHLPSSSKDSSKEMAEVDVTKGILEFNAKRWDRAKEFFSLALRRDPKCYLALEYLAGVEEAQGRWPKAVELLEQAKQVAPQQRLGRLDFRMGEIYFKNGDESSAKIYFLSATNEHDPPVHAPYYLGIIAYRGKNYVLAEKYFNDAREAVERPNVSVAERELRQAIFFYLGEIYARLGFFEPAAMNLAKAEPGASWEIRGAAWRTHSELNRDKIHLGAAVLAQYDTNVALIPIEGSLPGIVSGHAGAASNLDAYVEWNSGRYKTWSLFADGDVYWKNNFNAVLANFDFFNARVDAGLSYFTGEKWRVSTRYDFERTLADRNRWHSYHGLHGPSFFIDFFSDPRWRWEGKFFFHTSSFGRDAVAGAEQKSGAVTGALLSAERDAPNPTWNPRFEYSFEHNGSKGLEFRSDTHQFCVGLNWHLFEYTKLSLNLSYSWVRYPNSVEGRTDVLKTESLEGTHWFFPSLAGVLNFTMSQVRSTFRDQGYDRNIVTTGVLVRW